MMKAKAEEQAQFNAKYAAEQKAKADMFAAGLTQCSAEKEMVKSQKAALEVVLGETQTALSEEKETSAQLTSDLAQCNEDKAALTASLAEQTARADKAEEELATTKASLEEVRMDLGVE